MATLDVNTLNAMAVDTAVTTECQFTMYVRGLTGTHLHHHVMFEVSPDNGVNWCEVNGSVLGEGVMTISVSCTRIRAKVTEVEGAASTVDVTIIGK